MVENPNIQKYNEYRLPEVKSFFEEAVDSFKNFKNLQPNSGRNCVEASLYLSDILKRAGLDLERTKLIRHSLNDKEFKACFDAGFTHEYTQLQKKGFAKEFDHIITFISDIGTSAKLEGCYKVQGERPVSTEYIPAGYPAPDMFTHDISQFLLERTELLKDLAGRLIIEWGRSTISWHQKATNEKPVLAIQAVQKYAFSGFENVVLKQRELEQIVSDPLLYENWHTALRSVYAIYLITDRETGKHYVGSAYGEGGLFGRWKYYIESGHGGNKRMVELLKTDPDHCRHLQFSILQILPKSITENEVIALESLYKRKLQSIEFGLNDN